MSYYNLQCDLNITPFIISLAYMYNIGTKEFDKVFLSTPVCFQHFSSNFFVYKSSFIPISHSSYDDDEAHHL